MPTGCTTLKGWEETVLKLVKGNAEEAGARERVRIAEREAEAEARYDALGDTLYAMLDSVEAEVSRKRDAEVEAKVQAMQEQRVLDQREILGYRTHVATALGSPVEGILEKAAALNPDLILMGSRGRHGVKRLILGSVSHTLLHQGRHPLMVFS